MQLHDFNHIIGSLQQNGMNHNALAVASGPGFTYRYNPAGAGFQESLVLELTSNENIHVTLYQTTWDARAVIRNRTLGPRSIHLTNEDQQTGEMHRVFYEVSINCNAICIDNESHRERLAIDVFLIELMNHLK